MGNEESAQAAGNQAAAAPAAAPAPIRDFRPRRFVYNRAQKDRAVRLLNMGIPCRQVARMIGPRCSSGSPIRWRQQARRQEEARRRLDEMMRARGRQVA